MSEDIRAYIQRIRGYLGDQDPIDVLSRTPELLGELLEKSNDKFQTPVRQGKWSRAQVLAHLAEGEIVFGFRLRMVVSEPGTPILAYDQNKWMGNTGYLQSQPENAFALFKMLRLTNIAFLKSLPKEAWSFYGIHSERGKETVSDFVKLFAGHDLNHLRQMEID